MYTTFSYAFTPGNTYIIKSLIYRIYKILLCFMHYEYHDWNVKIIQYTPPQGYAFWDPKSEGSAFPYFPCTGDFDFLLKISPCMLALCCGVWGLFVFQTSPVCGPCVVVCGDFDFFKVPLCVGHALWCVGTLSFSKFPVCAGHALCCVWTLRVFKSPCV